MVTQCTCINRLIWLCFQFGVKCCLPLAMPSYPVFVWSYSVLLGVPRIARHPIVPLLRIVRFQFPSPVMVTFGFLVPSPGGGSMCRWRQTWLTMPKRYGKSKAMLHGDFDKRHGASNSPQERAVIDDKSQLDALLLRRVLPHSHSVVIVPRDICPTSSWSFFPIAIRPVCSADFQTSQPSCRSWKREKFFDRRLRPRAAELERDASQSVIATVTTSRHRDSTYYSTGTQGSWTSLNLPEARGVSRLWQGQHGPRLNHVNWPSDSVWGRCWLFDRAVTSSARDPWLVPGQLLYFSVPWWPLERQ